MELKKSQSDSDMGWKIQITINVYFWCNFFILRLNNCNNNRFVAVLDAENVE